MESATKSLHTKQCKFEILIDFMTSHPNLAKGYLKAPDAKQASHNLWNRLKKKLNAADTPMRDVPGWKKVWSDHKTQLKSKLRKNKLNFSGTGGGPAKGCSFTALEETAIDFLNIRGAVDGISGVRKFGVSTIVSPTNNATNQEVSDDIQYVLSEEMEIEHLISEPFPPRCSSTAFVNTPDSVSLAPFPHTMNKKQTLFEKQVHAQMDYHKRSISVMESIDSSLKSLVKYKRQQLDIEEEKLKLPKRKFKHRIKMGIEIKKINWQSWN